MTAIGDIVAVLRCCLAASALFSVVAFSSAAKSNQTDLDQTPVAEIGEIKGQDIKTTNVLHSLSDGFKGPEREAAYPYMPLFSHDRIVECDEDVEIIFKIRTTGQRSSIHLTRKECPYEIVTAPTIGWTRKMRDLYDKLVAPLDNSQVQSPGRPTVSRGARLEIPSDASEQKQYVFAKADSIIEPDYDSDWPSNYGSSFGHWGFGAGRHGYGRGSGRGGFSHGGHLREDRTKLSHRRRKLKRVKDDWWPFILGKPAKNALIPQNVNEIWFILNNYEDMPHRIVIRQSKHKIGEWSDKKSEDETPDVLSVKLSRRLKSGKALDIEASTEAKRKFHIKINVVPKGKMPLPEDLDALAAGKAGTRGMEAVWLIYNSSPQWSLFGLSLLAQTVSQGDDFPSQRIFEIVKFGDQRH